MIPSNILINIGDLEYTVKYERKNYDSFTILQTNNVPRLSKDAVDLIFTELEAKGYIKDYYETDEREDYIGVIDDDDTRRQ